MAKDLGKLAEKVKNVLEKDNTVIVEIDNLNKHQIDRLADQYFKDYAIVKFASINPNSYYPDFDTYKLHVGVKNA